MASVRFARWMISQGLIGDVLNIYIIYLKSSGFIENRPLEWRFQKELAGGGVLVDLGVHMIDLIGFLAGEISSVCAQTAIAVKSRRKLDSDEIAAVSTDDSCDALLSTKGGALASVSVSRCAVGHDNDIKVAIYGNKGMIRFDPMRQDVIEVCSGQLDFATNSVHSVKIPKSYFTEQMDAFARSVQGDVDPYLPTLHDGVICQRVVDALVEASENRRWVSI
jgi:predicted dehydrogenase